MAKDWDALYRGRSGGTPIIRGLSSASVAALRRKAPHGFRFPLFRARTFDP